MHLISFYDMQLICDSIIQSARTSALCNESSCARKAASAHRRSKMLKWLVKNQQQKKQSHTIFIFLPLTAAAAWRLETDPAQKAAFVGQQGSFHQRQVREAGADKKRASLVASSWAPSSPSKPDAFYHARLFLWVPYRLWSYRLLCSQPNCRRLGFPLTACGMYRTVRRVLDVSGWYFMATEYLECRSCRKKLAAWSQDILNQLDPVVMLGWQQVFKTYIFRLVALSGLTALDLGGACCSQRTSANSNERL